MLNVAVDVDSAFRLRHAHSKQCAALFEDPKGTGLQYVVSQAGKSYTLKDAAQGEAFLAAWKQDLQRAIKRDYPTLREVFYASYEVSRLFEELPVAKTMPVGGLVWRHQPVWCVCFSIKEQKIYLSSTQSEQDLDMLETWLGDKSEQPATDDVQTLLSSSLVPQLEQSQELGDDYPSAVEKVRQYIRAGDVFQANIARFCQQDFSAKHLGALYARLMAVNPAPFACFLSMHDVSLISASP